MRRTLSASSRRIQWREKLGPPTHLSTSRTPSIDLRILAFHYHENFGNDHEAGGKRFALICMKTISISPIYRITSLTHTRAQFKLFPSIDVSIHFDPSPSHQHGHNQRHSHFHHSQSLQRPSSVLDVAGHYVRTIIAYVSALL